MIKLRNPWGKVGRKYEFDLKKLYAEKTNCAIEDESLAEFEIDLTDFTTYFANYSVGELQATQVTKPSSSAFFQSGNKVSNTIATSQVKSIIKI